MHQPIVYIVASYILGIILGNWAPVSFVIFGFTYVSLLAAIILFRYRKVSLCLLWVTFILLGWMSIQTKKLVASDDIYYAARYYRHQPITLKGVVSSFVEKKNFFNGIKTTFYLDVKEIKTPWGWQKRRGKILIQLFREENLAYGNYIQIEGRLHRPYNFSSDQHFDYRAYLERQGISYILSAKKDVFVNVIEGKRGNRLLILVFTAREKLKILLAEYFSKNEAGLLQAILLGDRSFMPSHIRDLFVHTGTMHVVAISGFNVGIVAGLFLIFLKLIPMGRKNQLCVTILLLVMYALLTGASASVVRATIMAIVFILSFIIERETNLLNTLCAAASLILIYDPRTFFDVGFQLSFLCVLSIILFTPRIQEGIGWMMRGCGWREANLKNRWVKWSVDYVSVSLAVTLGAQGLVVYYFGNISFVTFLANLLIIPLAAYVVVLGMAFFLAVHIPLISPLTALCLKAALNGMVLIIYLCEKIPFSYIYVKDVKVWPIIIYYAIFLLLLYGPWLMVARKMRYLGRLGWQVVQMGLKHSSKIDKAHRV